MAEDCKLVDKFFKTLINKRFQDININFVPD
jgi:hypothetical protein